MKGITFNNVDISIYIEKEILRDISEVYISENKVSIYHNPRKVNNWSPYRGKASKVRKVEIK
jgi:hypothetical protein